MIRYIKWETLCNNCKWSFSAKNSKCKATKNCEKCENTIIGCNCLTECEKDEKTCPYYEVAEE